MADDDECAVIGEQPASTASMESDIQMVVGSSRMSSDGGSEPPSAQARPARSTCRRSTSPPFAMPHPHGSESWPTPPGRVVAGTGVEPLEVIEDRLAALQDADALVQKRERNVYGNRSFEGRQFSGDHFQKARLARPVGAGDRKAQRADQREG